MERASRKTTMGSASRGGWHSLPNHAVEPTRPRPPTWETHGPEDHTRSSCRTRRAGTQTRAASTERVEPMGIGQQYLCAKGTDMATPPTPEDIMQLGFGYWGSKTLLSAVELGLFTAL